MDNVSLHIHKDLCRREQRCRDRYDELWNHQVKKEDPNDFYVAPPDAREIFRHSKFGDEGQAIDRESYIHNQRATMTRTKCKEAEFEKTTKMPSAGCYDGSSGAQSTPPLALAYNAPQEFAYVHYKPGFRSNTYRYPLFRHAMVTQSAMQAATNEQRAAAGETNADGGAAAAAPAVHPESGAARRARDNAANGSVFIHVQKKLRVNEWNY